MADSDDEYDRRRRDKFRGERTGDARPRRDDIEYDRGRAGGGQIRSRGDYRMDAYRGREPRGYSPGPDLSPPPHKRMRADWGGGERRFPTGYGAGDGYGGGGGAPAVAPFGGGYSDADGPSQPPMMTFKAFLASQDDMITDDEAIKKYTEYKLDFRRQQLNEFFLAHKEEEWFKAKYHPEECVKRQEEQIANLKRRVDVFLERLEAQPDTRLDGDQAELLLRFLDSVVIRLEGGSDFDMTVLDLPEEDPADRPPQKTFVLDQDKKKKEEADKAKTEDLSKLPLTDEQKALQEKAKEFLKKKGEETKKRKYEYNSGSSSSSSSSDSDEPDEPAEPAPPGAENGSAAAAAAAADGEANKTEPVSADEGGELDGRPEPASPRPPGDTAPAEAAADGDEKAKREEDGEKKADKTEAKADERRPRPLHRTTSIFLRNLAPTITKQEVEAMCRRYPGFLRAAIADPQPERRWFRRGWVTFERQVNIKEICWNLNNIRLRDCELGAIVNRDLSRRVRTVNGITSHKQVVRADIKLAAKIIQNLDSRYQLWPDPDAEQRGQQPSYGVSSNNPILRNITDYLIEEASAEEEELLGVSASSQEEAPAGGDTIERDDELIKVLDRLLLYLRVVHSVDYYNHSEYPNEDEMPNRCGIIHARGLPPSSKVTSTEVQDYISSFENKIGSFLLPLTRWVDDECKKNGLILKDPEEEVEKFVQANTQELAKDKWLCPLSNKKFKGPDFVRKHIFNKHAEKVEEVKKEVEFFNNYLRDPKRPQLPEHPSAKAGGAGPSRKEDPPAPFHGAPYGQPGPPPPPHHYGGYGGYQRPPMYGGYQPPPPRDPYYREPYLPPRDAYPRPPRPYGARRDPRSIVDYRDLDAPPDVDLL
ncbi:serrate RNA effector molecule homolog isoform X1 [Amphibalanus amphitrite]|uniref:serrate RNA effector molecule homolog isoform X1 n=1 Tax=Amphibalanus amphitrite TaxID=1232801 RepID=UPI001C916DAA|nr:serrate RNA effector molecule homolog isoform X1 [Amphibalanus amphitrite]